MRVEIPFELLDPTRDNARRQYVHLDELALSIGEYGLLQNLIVREVVTTIEGQEVKRYEVRGGERRRRAIGLLMLSVEEQIKQYGKPLGSWLGAASLKSGCTDGGVPAFIIPASADEAAHLIENICREDLWPWEIGRRLASWNDAGYDQTWIADRLGKAQSYVSYFITIGRQLSPKVSDAIEKTGDKALVTKNSLLKLCRHYDPVLLEPMHLKQLEVFEQVLGTTRRRGPADESRSERIRVHKRAQRLGKMKVPGHAKLYVRAIYQYLFTDSYMTRPDFDFK